jgi:hypothetical protein
MKAWAELTTGEKIVVGIEFMNQYEAETKELPYKNEKSNPTPEYITWLEGKLYIGAFLIQTPAVSLLEIVLNAYETESRKDFGNFQATIAEVGAEWRRLKKQLQA